MLLKPRRRSISKVMVVLAATTGIVLASGAPAHNDAKSAVDSPQSSQRMGETMARPNDDHARNAKPRDAATRFS